MNKFNFKALLPVVMLLCAPLASHASLSVGVSIDIAPPELPIYVQPPIPEPGYIWTPGYWAWGPDGYYWVPGTWVMPPQVGFLWTPGYWGWRSGFYIWNAGYWGSHVGFYGGINYGYGYGGSGYEGGYWRGNRLYYNRSVNNINNVDITNVYNTTIINNTTVNRVSYNGGNGIRRQPSGAELSAQRDRHMGYTNDQRTHEQSAARDRSFLASVNHGRPAVAVTQRPGAFKTPLPNGGFNGNRGDRPNGGPDNRGPGAIAAPGAQTELRRDRPPTAQPGLVRPGADRMQRNDRPAAAMGPQNRYPATTRESGQRPQMREPQMREPQTRAPDMRAPEVRGAVREAPRPPQAQPRVPQQLPRGPQQQPERRGPEGRAEGRDKR